ncbi:Alpha/beta hydrolase fold-1 [Dillenia turbinata]|uniref:Alpha/beta hydrolase fold-1 n=1 Tax=Dillenia turbinata TaxID=194707 RepID=A0AAN8W6M2_9MAGN
MPGDKRVSAASARDHTRRVKLKSSSQRPSGLFWSISVIFLVGIMALGYQAIQPPPPKICGSPGGPPITAPRIKLRDGRHLAYKEHGVPKEKANYKIVFIHGFDCNRHTAVVPSMEIMEDLGIYVLSFDRPGYSESDPDPKRTPQSLALDIEELADQLELGSKFYVVGYSMGGQAVWGCLKYIPHRLAGAALLAPVVNYWWPGLPADLTTEAYYQQFPRDQWALRVAHYLPWLTYWWNTQKWFPGSSAAGRNPKVFSPKDLEILARMTKSRDPKMAAAVGSGRQQGEHESAVRDLMVGFGSWEFGPVQLQIPFPNNEGTVHLWQGDDDGLVPVTLQRYIALQLPWINYHEIPGAGHVFASDQAMADTIFKVILTGEK